MKTSYCRSIKKSPYEIVFGVKPNEYQDFSVKFKLTLMRNYLTMSLTKNTMKQR